MKWLGKYILIKKKDTKAVIKQLGTDVTVWTMESSFVNLFQCRSFNSNELHSDMYCYEKATLKLCGQCLMYSFENKGHSSNNSRKRNNS